LEEVVDTIVNPRTGQQMTFVTDSTELLEIDSISPPNKTPEPEHVHPLQESGSHVTAGVLRFQIAGEERIVAAGESITIPANTPHFFANDGPEDAHAIGWFRPALNTRAFFETLFALAQDGKLDDKGMPSLLQIAVMIPVFADVIRPTSPPWAIQRAASILLGPAARARGYRGIYETGTDAPAAVAGASR
jgi:mannose-6-phosphate isomerase-like protein (cupin superfamily)